MTHSIYNIKHITVHTVMMEKVNNLCTQIHIYYKHHGTCICAVVWMDTDAVQCMKIATMAFAIIFSHLCRCVLEIHPDTYINRNIQM